MPIYEYQCSECGHQTEVIQKISDEPLRDCPECGQATMKKMVSAAAFRLKGGGWYETDFKSGGKKNIADKGTGKKPADSNAGSDSGAKASGANKPSNGGTTTKKSS